MTDTYSNIVSSDIYSNPVPPVQRQEGAAGDEGPDWQDIGKGFVGGFGRGVTSIPGTGGNIGNLVGAGFRKLGVPEEVIKTGSAAARTNPLLNFFTGPGSEELGIQPKVEEYTGKFHEPQTVLGQYASTLGEFAPAAVVPGGGGVPARIVNTVIPALASETAGQITKGTKAEPWARAIAGVGAGVVGGKAVTVAPPATRARQAAAAVADREGIPISAGDRTGSKFVRLLEETAGEQPLSMGAWQAFRQRQLEELNRKVTGRTFDPAELRRRGIPDEGSHLPHSDVFEQGKKSLRNDYEQLSKANSLRSDIPLVNDLQGALTKYESNVLPSQRAGGRQNIEEIFHDIANNLSVNGTMSGETYQAIRSRLGRQAKTAFKSDPELGTALKETQAALDRAMRRNLSPADAAAWDLTNQRYANMKQLAPVVAKGGEFMTPAGIAQAVRSGRAEQAAAGAGNLDELANAANLLIKPLPNSMTAARSQFHGLFNLPSTLMAIGSGAGYLGGVLGPAGALLGAAAPHLVGSAVVSRLGQRYLGNRVAPMDVRDQIAQTLAQQAISNPAMQQ
jgi:hypothetical protein